MLPSTFLGNQLSETAAPGVDITFPFQPPFTVKDVLSESLISKSETDMILNVT